MTSMAFIGLGHMGSGMAACLLRAGHRVHAFDLNPEALARLGAQGAVACLDLASAIKDAEVVITMLPASNHVRDVYEGENGIFAHANKTTLLIDCSTIDVAVARDLGDMAQGLGFAMLDAPVSGGVVAARDGSLTFMVGGAGPDVDRARPALDAMGKAVIHAGPQGSGQAAKLCNNMLLAITMTGTCEAFTLARRLGLEDQVFYDIASQSSGQSWSLSRYCPVPGPVPTSPANRGYAPGFTSALMLKDLRLAMQAAHETGTVTTLGTEAHRLYEALCQNGLDQADFSAMMPFIEDTLSRPKD